jgi:hypothetical protein
MTRTDPCRCHWTDQPCYYVAVVDGGKLDLLAGPYRTRREALEQVDRVREAAVACGDPAAWLHAYGIVTLNDGHRPGLLNKYLEQALGRPL